MASTQKRGATELAARLSALEAEVRQMHEDLDARLYAIAEGLDLCRADDEAQTLAAERIRSGAADRTRDGAEVLAELGIDVR